MSQKTKILIVTSSYDKTIDYIITKFPHLDFFRFDTDRLSQYKLTVKQSEWKIRLNSLSINSDECLSIYYRKPALENLEGQIGAKYHSYVHKEAFALIEGIIEAHEGQCLSKPSVMRKANNKIYQSFIAPKVGFRLPDFAITNVPEDMQLNNEGLSIVKPVAIGQIQVGNEKEFVQTNLFDANKDLSSLRYSPVYSQKFINKDIEVRVTVVGDNFFSVKIDSEDNVDWRKLNNHVTYEPFEIPSLIRIQCQQFMQKCNMQFGCFDFIISHGEWYFLEMNANGQWCWLELELNLDISRSIINLLTEDKLANKC